MASAVSFLVRGNAHAQPAASSSNVIAKSRNNVPSTAAWTASRSSGRAARTSLLSAPARPALLVSARAPIPLSDLSDGEP